jgi:hypothetical protein
LPMPLTTPGVDSSAFSFLPRDWLIKYLNPIVPLERASPLVPLVGLLVWTRCNSLVVNIFPECIELPVSHELIAIFAAVRVPRPGCYCRIVFCYQSRRNKLCGLSGTAHWSPRILRTWVLAPIKSFY